MRKAKLLLAAACVLITSDVALSCVCVTPGVPDAFKQADVVFAGEVVSISNRRAKFKVEQAWKGVSSAEVIMLMGGSIMKRNRKETIVSVHTSCDYEFEVGERYLVYAGGDGRYFRAWTCSRTKRMSDAEQDLQKLGEGQPPKLKAGARVSASEAMPSSRRRRSRTNR